MKLSSPRAPLSPARARNCALLNQFGTPGLGSLMARRFVAGAGQLGVFLVGFGLFVAWFVDMLRQFYGMIESNADPQLHPRWALAGIAIAGLAWLWALFTSFSLLREGKRNEREGKLFAAPPVLPRT